MSTTAKYSNYDVVIMGMFRWDGPYSSISIALAKEFAKTNRVFYLNHPYSLKDYFSLLKGEEKRARRNALRRGQLHYEKDPQLPDNFHSVFLPITLPINFLSKGGLYNRLNAFNNHKIQKAIQQLVKEKNIKQFLYVNCFDPYFAPVLKAPLQPALNIYQCVDDITQEAYIARHGEYLEEAAIRAADLTLVTSAELYRLKSPFTPSIHTLNNAADISNFRRAAEESFDRPEELKGLKGKVIGFFGNLDNLRMDYPLLKSIAEAHPDKHLLLIGPLNNTEYQTIGLDQLPNVILTGPKHISELPAYLHYFDCAIIPFLCNKLTRSIYPLKINEYLSAGKPVISTPFSEDIKSFGEYIYLAKEPTEFSQQIERAIGEDSKHKRAERIALAGTNTWTARVEQFWTIVGKQLDEKRAYAPKIS
ncbi:MAG: glycosyltransferase [Bacteroidota bacterium]